MKTFKWTIPEPQHADHGTMSRPEVALWQCARARGVEWFVVTKGVACMLAHALLSHFCLGVPLTAQLFCEGWLLGLAAGSGVWLWRERRYERAIENGLVPPL
jgi:hypothetical protein